MLLSLCSKFSDYFPNYSKSCVKNLLVLCNCILLKETLNLHKLKGAVGTVLDKKDTNSNSHYKRLLRIFELYSFSNLWLLILCFVFSLIGISGKYLLLDGTSWKRGTKSYHYLTLAIVYREIAIPIYWLNLHKLGVSHTKERIKLMKKALKYFNLEDKILIADREYEGKEWFKFLIENKLDFVIRLKYGHYQAAIDQAEGKTYQALINKVKRSKLNNKAVKKSFYLEGMLLHFVVCKNPKNDPKEPFIFLLSSVDLPASKVAATYLIRWKIEHCFKHLKSNGFQLEQINLKHESRCRLLMAITVMAYVISVEEGLRTYKKVPNKIYADGKVEKQESVFRYGINLVMKFCASITTFVEFLLQKIKQHKQQINHPFCKFV